MSQSSRRGKVAVGGFLAAYQLFMAIASNYITDMVASIRPLPLRVEVERLNLLCSNNNVRDIENDWLLGSNRNR